MDGFSGQICPVVRHVEKTGQIANSGLMRLVTLLGIAGRA